MTLSIGDGANDVAMIQEANVGCGLLGYEGSQAAMSADYAFGQFRFLTKLLIVHGRWSYQRIADMHSNFFYKNVIWTLAMFWFMIFNSFDATYLYEYTFILLYNLVFTSLPVIVLGAFDQDINAKAALAFPQLYIRGIRGLEYTRLKFWLYMLDGLYQSAVVFFIPYLVWTVGVPTSYNGRSIESLADFGTTVSVAAIFAANTYVGISTHYWTVITWVIVVGSSLVMLLWIVIYSFFESPDFVLEVVDLMGQPVFWFTVLVSVFIALAPRLIVIYTSITYWPLDKDIVREMWVQGDLKDRLGIAHRRDVKAAAKRDLEQAPMFHHPHARSESEISAFQQDIDHSPPRSPASVPSSTSSPAAQADTLNPSHDPQLDELLSPSRRAEQASSPYSFRGSYYSASAIPAPSPVPSPSHDRSRSPQMAAVSQNPVTSHAQPASSSSSRQTQASRRSSVPEAYEMHVRAPSDDLATPQAVHSKGMRNITEESYATAYDSLSEADEEEQPTPAGHQQDPSWRSSAFSSYSGPHVM